MIYVNWSQIDQNRKNLKKGEIQKFFIYFQNFFVFQTSIKINTIKFLEIKKNFKKKIEFTNLPK